VWLPEQWRPRSKAWKNGHIQFRKREINRRIVILVEKGCTRGALYTGRATLNFNNDGGNSGTLLPDSLSPLFSSCVYAHASRQTKQGSAIRYENRADYVRIDNGDGAVRFDNAVRPWGSYRWPTFNLQMRAWCSVETARASISCEGCAFQVSTWRRRKPKSSHLSSVAPFCFPLAFPSVFPPRRGPLRPPAPPRPFFSIISSSRHRRFLPMIQSQLRWVFWEVIRRGFVARPLRSQNTRRDRRWAGIMPSQLLFVISAPNEVGWERE